MSSSHNGIDRIYVDTREKPHAIVRILAYFERHGIEVIHQKLDVGDYAASPDAKLTVDRKQSLQEVCGNLAQQHERFTRECVRAQQNGVHLVVLVEHGGPIRTMQDVKNWRNPRLSVSPYAISGERLYRLMRTYQEKYGVEWRFCDKRSTGRVIVEILGGANNMIENANKVAKIKEITEEHILFNNGDVITFYHEQDCCEENYADFLNHDSDILNYEFQLPLRFEAVEEAGFRFGDSRRMYFIPCYSAQNGYYSWDIQILLNGKEMLDFGCEKQFY